MNVYVTDATGTFGFFGCGSYNPSGAGPTNCAAGLGTGGGPWIVQLPAGVPLQCNVSGYGAGTYSCYSALL